MTKQTRSQTSIATKIGDALPDSALDQVTGGKPMGEMLSNVSKTRSEISMTFARNARA